MRFLLLTIFLLPLLTFAEEGGQLTIGDRTVSYDSTHSSETGTLYYQGEQLVLSEHGSVRFVYENDAAVVQAHDTDGDGISDTFVTLTDDGLVDTVSGESTDTFTAPTVVEFAELLEAEGEGGSEAAAPDNDLVGSLDRIKVPKGSGFPWLLVLLIAGGYWWYRKRKRLGEM